MSNAVKSILMKY